MKNSTKTNTFSISNKKLKISDPKNKDLMLALKAQIRKLHKQNISLQAQHISDQERISVLEEELKKEQSRPTLVVHRPKPSQEK
jgi:hypothetical protein